MTALATERQRLTETWATKSYTLKSGTKAYKGGRAAYEVATNKVIPAVSGIGLIPLGIFARTVDATLADKVVPVELEREIQVEWFENATSTDAVAAGDVMKDAFMLDDQTVTITAAGRSRAGRIWAVDATKGVAIERAHEQPATLAAVPAVGSYTANDYAPATLVHGGLYDVPTTAAASTVTLPAAAPDGTIVRFAADGTKNAHTVQYRDATGSVALTTALTLAKRHLVVCAKRDGKWFANAYVSP